MICPQCKSEYREGFDRCADCDVPLVESLPVIVPALVTKEEPSQSTEDEDLVTVYHTGDVALLPLLKSVLVAAGIPYVVHGEDAFGMEPSGGGWTKADPNLGVRFQVPRTRAEEAIRILRELDASDV